MPAPSTEQLVTESVARLLPLEPQPLVQLRAVHLRADGFDLVLPGKFRRAVQDHFGDGETVHRDGGPCIVRIPVALPLRDGGTKLAHGKPDREAPDATLIGALRKAHTMLGRDCHGRPTLATAPASAYERRILRLVFLNPALQADILAGRQPRRFKLETFLHAQVPLAWKDQPGALGWPADSTS